MLDDATIAKQCRKHKNMARSKLTKQTTNTKTCYAFYDGDTVKISGNVSVIDSDGKIKQTLCEFNKVKPYVHAVSGFTIQNRRSTVYSARAAKPAQEFYSDYMNGFHAHCRDNMRADYIEARQTLDQLICGIGVTDTYLSFDVGRTARQAGGEIGMMRLEPLGYWWDPAARETNLIDRRFDGYTRVYDLEDAIKIFDAESGDFETAGEQAQDDYQWNPRGGIKNLIREGDGFYSEDENLINVDFYQWSDIEDYFRADNPIYSQSDPELVMNLYAILQSAASEDDDLFNPKDEILSCTAETKAKIDALIPIDWKKFKRTAYYSAVVSGNKVFSKYKNICQDGFSRKVKTGEWNETSQIWVGMVNAMINPQKYFNKSITEFLYTIAFLAKGGKMYEKGAIENIVEFEQNYLNPAANVEVAKGALTDGRIQDKRQPYQQTGIESVIQLSDAAFEDVTGIPEGFLGASESANMTAALHRQLVKQALNTIAAYVDAITLYGKEHARLMLDLMRELAAFGGDQYFKMMDNGEEQLVPVMPDKIVNEYDIEINEAPDSDLERSERASALTSMGSLYIQAGDINRASVIFGIALDDMRLDSRKKAKLMKVLEPQEQPSIDPAEHAAMKQQLEQMQQVIQSGMLEKTKSEAEKNRAAVEKMQTENIKILEESRKLAAETDLVPQFDTVSVTI